MCYWAHLIATPGGNDLTTLHHYDVINMYLFHAPVLHSMTHLCGIPVGIVDTRIVTLVQPLCVCVCM